jgi:hypothetical protein
MWTAPWPRATTTRVVTVKDAGGGKSIVEWKGTFKRLAYWTDNPPEGMDDKTVYGFIDNAYKNSLANLKKVIEEGREWRTGLGRIQRVTQYNH